MESIKFEPLRSEWIQETINMIVDANILQFPLITSGQITEQSFREETKKLIKKAEQAKQIVNNKFSTNTEFSFVLRCQEEIVAAMLTIDYAIYHKYVEHLFGVSQYHQMFSKIPPSNIREMVYFSRLSVKPGWMGKGMAKRLIFQISQYLKEHGYMGSYSGLINKKTQHILMSFGGVQQVVCQYKSDYIDDQIKVIKNNFQIVLQSQRNKK